VRKGFLFLKKKNHQTTILVRIFERGVMGSSFQKRAGGHTWQENLHWEVSAAGAT